MKYQIPGISDLQPEYFIQYGEGPNLTKSTYMQAVEIHQKIQEPYPFFMFDFHVLKAFEIHIHQYVQNC